MPKAIYSCMTPSMGHPKLLAHVTHVTVGSKSAMLLHGHEAEGICPPPPPCIVITLA